MINKGERSILPVIRYLSLEELQKDRYDVKYLSILIPRTDPTIPPL